MYYLDKSSEVPLYHQLYTAIKEDIVQNSVKDSKLPAIRTLAKELCISNNTVNQAYQQLLAEGYIHAVQGSGYYVNSLGNTSHTGSESIQNVAFMPVKNVTTARYNFFYGSLENQDFPWVKWRECLREAIHHQEDAPLLEYEDKQGYYPLRQAIAAMIDQTRGVKCEPEQIVICSGVQYALYLINMLCPPRDYEIGFEEPGYSTARNVFYNCGYNIHTIPCSSGTISYDDLERSGSRLIYLTPSHQFPMGHVLPISCRNSLITYINHVRGYLIEDDYDSEFRYKSLPIPSLHSLDTNDRVIYIGTFSKSFLPTIRVAYLVLPKSLMSTYNIVCRDHKTPVAHLIQYALYLFIAKGYYMRHTRRVVKAMRRKYDRIVELFNEAAPKNIEPIFTGSGVHLMLVFHTPLSEAALLEYLEQHGIRLYPTSHYWFTTAPHPVMLQMGFASLSIKDIEDSLRLLFTIIP